MICCEIYKYHYYFYFQTKLDANLTAKFGGIGTLIFALLLSVAWKNHGSWLVGGTSAMQSSEQEHALSGGAVFSFVLYGFGKY